MFTENTEELAQNKLLLLYLIDKSEEELDKNDISEFMLEKDHMNYFLVQQYLSELTGSQLIELIDGEDKPFYRLTEAGQIALSYFIERVNENFKKDVITRFTKTRSELKKETEVFSEFFQKENGQYVVSLKLIENQDTLFSVYLDVATEDLAIKVSENWKNHTDDIYLNVIKTLTKE